MKRTILSILAVSLLFACWDNTQPTTVSKNGITIILPGYLSEEELADDAFIEYANRYRNFYLAGFEIPHAIPLDSAGEISARRIYGSLDKYEIVRSKDSDSNLRTTMKGQFKDEPEYIYYYQKILTGSEKRYLLTVWIRGDERNKKYEEDIQSILNSFRIK